MFFRTLTKHFKRNVLPVCLDISIEGLKKCKEKGLLGIRGSATHLPFKNSSADVVLCIQTLEHIIDDQKAIVEMARITKNRGIVYLASPNKLTNMYLPLMLSSRIVDIVSRHVRSGYDVAWIQKEFERGGCTMLSVKYYGFLGSFLKFITQNLFSLTMKIFRTDLEESSLGVRLDKLYRKIDEYFSGENPRGSAFRMFLKKKTS